METLTKTESGNPILRKKAKDVSVSKIRSEKIQTLIKQMFHTLKKKGVGLAAPHVGVSLRLAVLEVRIKAKQKNKKMN